MSSLLHASVANVRTPCLPRALANYTQALGFACRQLVPGVFARLSHGPLCVQLWACGATPGRWERCDGGQQPFEPAHHRVEVAGIHALHRSLRVPDSAAPEWQPWGAWEARLTDIDGNVLHLIDRAAWRPNDASWLPSVRRAVP